MRRPLRDPDLSSGGLSRSPAGSVGVPGRHPRVVALLLMIVGLSLSWMIAGAVGASAGTVPPGPRAATETIVAPTPDAPITAPPATTGPKIAAGEPSPVASGGNTPQPVGRALPPRTQRIGDSLVWLWVMLLLIGGGFAGIFARRRRSGRRHDSVEAKSSEAAGQ